MQPTEPRSPPRSRRADRAPFWRAARFVLPYRRMMVISIVAALFVGLTSTAGMAMLLPIMRLLLAGDTVAGYVDRAVAERRLGVTFEEGRPMLAGPAAATMPAANGVHLAAIGPKSPAARLGLHRGDLLRMPGADANIIAELSKTREPISTLGINGVDRPVNLGPATFRTPVLWGVAPIVQAVAHRLPAQPIPALGWLLGGLLLLACIGSFFRFFQEHYSDMVAIRAINDVRRKTYDHLLHVPLAYFGQRGTSDATSRLVGDAASMQDGFKLLLGQSIQAPIQAGMYLALALYTDWRITAFIICCAPISMAVIRKLGKKVRRATRTALQKNSRMLGQLEASLAGVQVVKASMSERFERRRYSRIMGEMVEQQRRMSRYEALTTPTMETLTMVVVSVVVLYAAYLVLVDGSLEREDFFVIMGCLIGMGESLRKMSKLNNLLQKANAAATRIFEILDLPVERRRTMATKPGVGGEMRKLPPLSVAITFDEVSFSYPGHPDHRALDRVTLDVPKGRVVAVVGRNGSGKTTLLRLLPRLYQPTAGRVLIDGVDIAGVTLPSLRGQISLVTQESIIFPGTIAENIAYGLPLAPRAAIEAAARKAFAHDFISAKPQGYDTPLEGIGGQLSGGQRQRLCIARAILRHAPILILDEATSQVDAESEHLIQQAIDSLLHETASAGQRTTTFVIAHRFSTILSADEIVVMEQGRIVGRGKHRDLLESCPTYRQLYERQVMNPDE